jgi:catechol 2,3-dioxygenase-like lactoylglutathione lyase family enzyme
MDASAAWYQRVFGWVELRRLTAAEAGTPRVLLLDTQSFFSVALCQPDDAQGSDFDHRVTGLDHFGLLVSDEAELARWSTHLGEQEVVVSPVREVPGLGKFISFEDLDGIQLELWVNASRR